MYRKIIDNVMSSMSLQIQSIVYNNFDDCSVLYSTGHVYGMLDILLDIGLISKSDYLSCICKFDCELSKQKHFIS